MKATRETLILAPLLVLYIMGDLLLTPLGGLETRPVAEVTTTGVLTLVVLFVGLALSVSALALVFWRPRRSPILAAAASVLYFPAFLADQGGLFSRLRPPTAIVTLEIFQAVVAIAVIVAGLWLIVTMGPGAPAAGNAR